MFLFCCPRRRSSLDAAKLPRNPFLIDLVIEVVLEEADVKTLKTFRKMNSNWNKLDLKELGKRALKGQLEEIDFSVGCQEKLDDFLENTAGIPQLFVSFCLNFPGSSTHSFYPKYTPKFLHLEFFKNQFSEDIETYLVNFDWIAPTLQELKVKKTFDYSSQKQGNLSSIPRANVIPNSLVFPKLTKLIWDIRDYPTKDDQKAFKFILDRSGTIDPTPNLTHLEACFDSDFLRKMIETPASRWYQLTHLRIFEADDCDDRLLTTLLTLGQGGMRLKVFSMSFGFPLFEESPEMYQNWSNFLGTQAKSLQVLDLAWYFWEEDASGDAQINLPIFENLHSFFLYIRYGDTPPPASNPETRLFKSVSIPACFPKLDHLKVNQPGFLNMFPLGGEPIRSLKRLNLKNTPDPLGAWTCNFPSSVESFKCEGSIFRVLGAEIASNCLKVLEINGVNFPLKVAQFKSLRKLVVRDRIFIYQKRSVEEYLAFFYEVRSLKLSSITFLGMGLDNKVKARFIRQFPFPVKFK